MNQTRSILRTGLPNAMPLSRYSRKAWFGAMFAVGSSGRLCENSEAFETVEKGYHIHDKINDLIPTSVLFMLQSGTTW